MGCFHTDAGLLTSVTAVQELARAHQKVEGGQLEDHPKQAALRRLLASLATMSPVRGRQQLARLGRPVCAAGTLHVLGMGHGCIGRVVSRQAEDSSMPVALSCRAARC